MKKILSACVLLVLTALSGCDSSRVEGTYYNISNPREYLELKDDSKFHLKADNMDLSGNYSVNGKIIILNSGNKMAAKGTIKKRIITDSEGIMWQKR